MMVVSDGLSAAVLEAKGNGGSQMQPIQPAKKSPKRCRVPAQTRQPHFNTEIGFVPPQGLTQKTKQRHPRMDVQRTATVAHSSLTPFSLRTSRSGGTSSFSAGDAMCSPMEAPSAITWPDGVDGAPPDPDPTPQGRERGEIQNN